MIKIVERKEDEIKTDWVRMVPEARVDEDLIQLGHSLDETRSNSLKALAFFYSEFGGYERELDEYKAANISKTEDFDYLSIPEPILREYAIMDAIVTFRVFQNMLQHVRELDKKYASEFYEGHGIEHYYRTFRIPACRMYCELEYKGAYVNIDKLNAAREKIREDSKRIELELQEAFGVNKNFNFGSSDSLGKLLEEKGWTDYGRNAKGVYLVGKDQLRLWIKEGREEAKLLKQYASDNTLIGTFTGKGLRNRKEDCGWAACIRDHGDGSSRLHPVFHVMSTDSGRSRCSSPNLQQTATRGTFAADIKKAISTPNDDEFYLCTVDYASLQLRICAMDEDRKDNLGIAFEDLGVDIHSSTGNNTFCRGKKFDTMTVTVEQDGQTYEFLGGEKVITTNRGEIFAKDLTDEDTLRV